MPPRKTMTIPARGAKPALRGNSIDTSGATAKDILKLTKDLGVDFLRLQFTDITGINKNVEVPASQFEKALDGRGDHVRRLVDRGLRAHRGERHAPQAGSGHVPDLPL